MFRRRAIIVISALIALIALSALAIGWFWSPSRVACRLPLSTASLAGWLWQQPKAWRWLNSGSESIRQAKLGWRNYPEIQLRSIDQAQAEDLTLLPSEQKLITPTRPGITLIATSYNGLAGPTVRYRFYTALEQPLLELIAPSQTPGLNCLIENLQTTLESKQ
ncbi:MAG: hypothetical protein CEO22_565 [Candidatus Berkelbacteria bacterium Gr01-1014_85]|uniref:Uncharacterized protein n=1 Tax=Candidatus Berkelbacteria bacterium Gr01-1014_85 TaxID=2017150 RepID=A0A554JA50_9BACT|nr:MAG: hypothetical protein CEO22_565 [Candidatus Berkelbacteria bacterium Gr01-1014_85]